MSSSISNVSVLYVEDDENDVFFASRAFSNTEGPKLRIATSGKEAVDLLSDGLARQPVVQPALVVLDLNLPYFNGHEVLQWIRAQPQFATMPVVIFTSSSQISDIAKAYESGATAYVAKPNSGSQIALFAQAVQKAISTGTIDSAAFSSLPGFHPRAENADAGMQ